MYDSYMSIIVLIIRMTVNIIILKTRIYDWEFLKKGRMNKRMSVTFFFFTEIITINCITLMILIEIFRYFSNRVKKRSQLGES